MKNKIIETPAERAIRLADLSFHYCKILKSKGHTEKYIAKRFASIRKAVEVLFG